MPPNATTDPAQGAPDPPSGTHVRLVPGPVRAGRPPALRARRGWRRPASAGRALQPRSGIARPSDSRPTNPSAECRPAASLSADSREASMPMDRTSRGLGGRLACAGAGLSRDSKAESHLERTPATAHCPFPPRGGAPRGPGPGCGRTGSDRPVSRWRPGIPRSAPVIGSQAGPRPMSLSSCPRRVVSGRLRSGDRAPGCTSGPGIRGPCSRPPCAPCRVRCRRRCTA